MSSDPPQDVYVWIYLAGRNEPVVAGRLYRTGTRFFFNYGRSYLANPDAIAIYTPELPLRPGGQAPLAGLAMPGAIRDAAPDAWGRRVILNRKLGFKGNAANIDLLDELTYLLESGSDRAGALDFQPSPDVYVPRQTRSAPLEDLMTAAEKVESGIPVTPELEQALFHGSSLGGARPKALIEDADRKYIAKFSSQKDITNVVKAEYVAMQLARAVGIDAAQTQLVRSAGRDVLLVERFDRMRTNGGWRREAFVSALTMLELDEMMARYASYERLAEIVRRRFADPLTALRELYARLVFNVLCGNTDDHARNHAAFWSGTHLRLTPAYDICPQQRTGGEASQAMLITGDNRMSTLAACLAAAPAFLQEPADAERLIAGQVETIRARWAEVCDEAELSPVDRRILWRGPILNSFAFEGAPAQIARLAAS